MCSPLWGSTQNGMMLNGHWRPAMLTVCRSSRLSRRWLLNSALSCFASSRGVSSCTLIGSHLIHAQKYCKHISVRLGARPCEGPLQDAQRTGVNLKTLNCTMDSECVLMAG